MGWVQIAKAEVEYVVARARQSHILNLGRDFMMNDGLLVFTHYINAQFQRVVLTKFMWLGFPVLW